jgi:hypothetical protein
MKMRRKNSENTLRRSFMSPTNYSNKSRQRRGVWQPQRDKSGVRRRRLRGLRKQLHAHVRKKLKTPG